MTKLLDIATGRSASTKIWKNTRMSWNDLVKKLQKEHHTNETYKEFIAASKAEQSKIKDVGGYVGGYIKTGRRKPENIKHRQLLTLDADFAYMDLWQDITLLYDCAAVLHATHKHIETSPRFRLIIPLDRPVSPDEYGAISRHVAGAIGIDLFDNTTFEPNRLMFWPSNPIDMSYYCEVQEGPFLSADEILQTYQDWTDPTSWPTSEAATDKIERTANKQQDPTEKAGIIGAFCRAYDIHTAIEAFLSEEYEPTAESNRYTYSGGSTAAGLIVYNDLFAYSHHGTDPCSGLLCNAFDLVRLHKYGRLDPEDEQYSKNAKKASFKAMEDLIVKDPNVKEQIGAEAYQNAKYDFQDEPLEPLAESNEWLKKLDVDKQGNYKNSATNVNIILSEDPRLKGAFKTNLFDGRKYVFKSLPWRKVAKPEPVKNVDLSGVRNYMESIYNITGAMKIEDALVLEFEKNSYHPIRDYLEATEWDKVQRLDYLLIDYFGAKDCEYTREAVRKMLVAAVARVYSPGRKYDLVLTLVGRQGTGKSTFIKKLGVDWFSDTFLTVQGKEALEQIQGVWLMEMAELAGLRKAEVEAVKHFISKQEDVFRPAYARTSETYPRQCVFFGTTNNQDFLRDPSGNRRFLPVQIHPENALKCIFNDFGPQEVAQVWAEAVELYKTGERLYLSPEAEATAYTEQKKHSETDERKGLIEEYLEAPLPEDWDSLDLYERRDYLSDPLSPNGGHRRGFVCVAEVWAECLGKEPREMDRYKTREINDILRSLEGWGQSNSTKNFAIYGKQKFYYRVD